MPEQSPARAAARVQDNETEVSFVSKPVPDPTERTTQQLYRAIDVSQRQVETKMDGIQAVIATRIDAMDRAIVLAQTSINKIPDQVLAAVGQLSGIVDGKIQVVNERFKSIETQFIERDTRTEQTSRDSKVAVDAALQAAKEAVGEQNKSSALAISKSEAATTKQIDAIGLLIQSNTKNIDDKIDDLKTGMSKLEQRINGIEARKEGMVETKQGVNATTVITIAALSAAVSLIMAIFAIFHH
jgi:hypothetical protein